MAKKPDLTKHCKSNELKGGQTPKKQQKIDKFEKEKQTAILHQMWCDQAKWVKFVNRPTAFKIQWNEADSFVCFVLFF